MKKLAFKLLVRPKLVGQAINYVASFIAGYVFTAFSNAPAWVSKVLEILHGDPVTVTEGSLVAFFTVLFAQVANWIITSQNVTGIDAIQEKLIELGEYPEQAPDSWAGEKTVGAVMAALDMLEARKALSKKPEDDFPMGPPPSAIR